LNLCMICLLNYLSMRHILQRNNFSSFSEVIHSNLDKAITFWWWRMNRANKVSSPTMRRPIDSVKSTEQPETFRTKKNDDGLICTSCTPASHLYVPPKPFSHRHCRSSTRHKNVLALSAPLLLVVPRILTVGVLYIYTVRHSVMVSFAWAIIVRFSTTIIHNCARAWSFSPIFTQLCV
jgi:hypothetical protein